MNEIVVPLTPVKECPLCHRAAVCEPRDNVHMLMTCEHCGVFELTDTARVALETLPQALLLALTRAVQASMRAKQEARLTLQSLAHLMAPYL